MKARFFAFALLLPGYLAAETPLSAIDWLDEQRLGSASETGQKQTKPIEPPVSSSVNRPDIEVSTLTEIQSDSVGLLPPSVTGFPLTMWHNSSTKDLVTLLGNVPVSHNPAIQSLTLRVLLAEGDAPSDSEGKFTFFAARLKKLIDYGAIDPALALVERAAPLPAPLVPLLFDLSLLSDTLQPACDQVLQLGPSYPHDDARIYCLARRGDWLTATLMLDAASALGTLSSRKTALMQLFLEDEAFDTMAIQLPPSSAPTPLEFRLYEAIGEPLAATSLPRAFAVSDLSGDHGWKAQLHAAERLIEFGALGDNRFLGIYTDNEPAASGGIWDRISAIQQLDQALLAEDRSQISLHLNNAWQLLGSTALAAPMARLFSARLLSAELNQDAAQLAGKIALLSPNYETAAEIISPKTDQEAFLISVATGDFTDYTPQSEFEKTIQDAFQAPRIPYSVNQLMSQGKLGEVILNAMIQFEKGAAGDLQDLLESLSTLRLIGLEDTARRATLALVILAN